MLLVQRSEEQGDGAVAAFAIKKQLFDVVAGDIVWTRDALWQRVGEA